MHIAVTGCCHGELEETYQMLEKLQEAKETKVDLLLICGDFQAIRNKGEMRLMACPQKYRRMGTYFQYYNGTKTAPLMTIVIGGNHEASLHFYELYYGGWLAPNIYFLGYAGVVNFNGLRIAGLSGIYKSGDYAKGHFEAPPFSSKAENKSVYHVREFETECLLQLSGEMHVLMAHDWPKGICGFGDRDGLIKKKPFLKADIMSNRLGSLAGEKLMASLQPDYFFSAHLHCKFAAFVKHSEKKETRFLALSKCQFKRDYMQIMSFPAIKAEKTCLEYDVEWLAVVKKTIKHIPFSTKPIGGELYDLFKEKGFRPTKLDIDEVLSNFGGDLEIPNNFSITAKPFANNNEPEVRYSQNPQTKAFLDKLGVEDVFLKRRDIPSKPEETIDDIGDKNKNADEIDLNAIFG